MSVSCFSPASGHDEGDSSDHGRPQVPCCAAGTPVLLPAQPCLPSSCSSFTHWQGDGSAAGRRLLLPSNQQIFTMGMHLFIGAGFIFMETELWAGAVPGESAGLLCHTGHCGGTGLAAGATKAPGTWVCSQRSVGFLYPALAENCSRGKHGKTRTRRCCALSCSGASFQATLCDHENQI